jgi:hypothetical protein
MKANQVTSIIPANIEQLLEPSALLPSEDRGRYMAMIREIAKSVPPLDFLTWMLIREIVEQYFEVDRARRYKNLVIKESGLRRFKYEMSMQDLTRSVGRTNLAAARQAEEKEIGESGKTAQEIASLKVGVKAKYDAISAEEKAQEDEDNRKRLESLDLLSMGLNSPSSWIKHYEQFDALFGVALARYQQSLQELENHVMGFGRALRESVSQIIEGDLAPSEQSSQQRKSITNDRGQSEVARTKARGGSIGRPTPYPTAQKRES